MIRIFFFFFNDPATTEIYTLSLHDALPICDEVEIAAAGTEAGERRFLPAEDDLESQHRIEPHRAAHVVGRRSEEHTSELQSQSNLVCRLLLEKKKRP